MSWLIMMLLMRMLVAFNLTICVYIILLPNTIRCKEERINLRLVIHNVILVEMHGLCRPSKAVKGVIRSVATTKPGIHYLFFNNK